MSKFANLKIRKINKFQEKPYRDAYVASHIRNNVAYQLRTIREQRGWTQEELAQKANKTQNTISRLEDPEYGKLTIKTLLEIASALDVALLIKFVPFSQFFGEISNLSPEALSAKSFTEEFTKPENSQPLEQPNSNVVAGNFLFVETVPTPTHTQTKMISNTDEILRSELTPIQPTINTAVGGTIFMKANVA